MLCFITTIAKKSLYLRPVDLVLDEVEATLKHALDIACNKFDLKIVIRWFFNTSETTDFQTLIRKLDVSIGNMKWLLTVYDLKNNDAIMSLASLAENNNMYKKFIVEEGGLPPLLKLLEETDSLDAQIAAADALCTLTNDPEIMKYTVVVIARLLKDAPIEVQIQAVNLVATMAELDAATEYDSTEGNVIWPLVTLLSSEPYADDPEIKLVKRLRIGCAKALWMLAARSVSNCRTIAETKALLCLAKLVEKERGKLQYYCLMTIMEITAAIESDIRLQQAVFRTNSPSAKAVVDLLLRVIKESDYPTMLVPAIKSVGSLARVFPSREKRVIGLLVPLLDHRNLTVATEASNALQKSTSPENYLYIEHWKSLIEVIN
ncbi:hypothetical protein PTKIN_Ptkin02bG0244000 [Pterospermum kingtungense]